MPERTWRRCGARSTCDADSTRGRHDPHRRGAAAAASIVTGVGKPEHVARYAASLLCSVGTLATFLHATETLHGSLGQVHPNDVVIAISNSGNTVELLRRRRGRSRSTARN